MNRLITLLLLYNSAGTAYGQVTQVWTRYQQRMEFGERFQTDIEVDQRTQFAPIVLSTLLLPRLTMSYQWHEKISSGLGAAHFSTPESQHQMLENGQWRSEFRPHADLVTVGFGVSNLTQRLRAEYRWYETTSSQPQVDRAVRLRYLFDFTIPILKEQFKNSQRLLLHLGNELMFQNNLKGHGWQFNQNRFVPAISFRWSPKAEINLSAMPILVRDSNKIVVNQGYRLTLLHTITR